MKKIISIALTVIFIAVYAAWIMPTVRGYGDAGTIFGDVMVAVCFCLLAVATSKMLTEMEERQDGTKKNRDENSTIIKNAHNDRAI